MLYYSAIKYEIKNVLCFILTENFVKNKYLPQTSLTSFKHFKLLYCALVRSILEYGAPIWNPYTKTYIDFIERVQNRSFLNIPALSSRREIADISFIYKLINGFTDDPDLLKCIPFTIPAYNNRSTSLFYIPVFQKVVSRGLEKKFQVPLKKCIRLECGCLING
ncbi:putative RNA-directed DNA polymerase [Aphis craccivora]|uniref:Putative RNA-directed DNA polymerase n=1 Tax=Aphis craccivora TaxID=307492 RepID=A0A6G0ZBQ4_APHCR|nr:putative RNA-directed DNA polymerase [Aphis craccivora]